MALKLWLGSAQTVSQTHTYTVAGTPAATDTIYIEVNSKRITYTLITGDTVSTAASALVALLNSAPDGEFRLVSWSVSAGVITATAAVPGEPFTAAGTGTLTNGATGTTTMTAAVVLNNSSPNDVANTANWSGGTLPVNADTVLIEENAQGLYWNLSTLSAVTIASWKVRNTFAPNRNGGWIGNPVFHPTLGFREFRGTELTLTAATILEIAHPAGAPANAFLFNTGSTAMAGKLLGPGGQTPGQEVVIWRGTGVGNSWEVFGSSLAIEPQLFSATATAVCQTFKAIQGVIRLEAGVTVSTSVDLRDSAFDSRVTVPTHTQNGDTSAAVYRDAAAISTALIIDAGPVQWNSSGTIATMAGGSNGTIDFSNAKTAITVGGAQGTVVLQEGFTYRDPQKRTFPFTNVNTLLLNRCGINNVTWELGDSIYLQLTTGP